MLLSDSVTSLRGVGEKRAEALASLGLYRVEDLLFYSPLRYEDRRSATKIADLVPESASFVDAIVEQVSVRRVSGKSIYAANLSVEDTSASMDVLLFGSFRSFMSIKEGCRILLYGTPKIRSRQLEIVSPEYALIAADERLPAEWSRILPLYPTTKSLSRRWLANLIYSCVTSDELKVIDPLPEVIINKNSFPTLKAAFKGIHAPLSWDEIERARERLAYQEFYMLQRMASDLRSSRGSARVNPLSSGTSDLSRFLKDLPFVPTDSQLTVIREISSELSGDIPMNRLLQGDVGSGKTVVALAAIAQAVGAQSQAAVLAPTTVLSEQLYSECIKHLAPLGVRCTQITGRMSEREKSAARAGVESGDVDVVVGTHALLEDSISFKKLGLVVIDEQQRFGVLQRKRLIDKAGAVHILMMSATPIPRTLCMALYGDMDSSLIKERPGCRKPIVTKIVSDNHMDSVYAFLSERVERGGRCYWVCPSIGDEDDESESASVFWRASDIKRALPGVRVESLHGRMSADEKNDALTRLDSGDASVLVSTTVVEVGIDISQANIMIIESAASFGLSQLHQLRGRVGRRGEQGICILIDSAKNIKGNMRLNVLKNCNDGFIIAEEDLKQRGAGELMGVRQHGAASFRIADIVRDARLLERARQDIGLCLSDESEEAVTPEFFC